MLGAAGGHGPGVGRARLLRPLDAARGRARRDEPVVAAAVALALDELHLDAVLQRQPAEVGVDRLAAPRSRRAVDQCQPALALLAGALAAIDPAVTGPARDALRAAEALRVRPLFDAVRYGRPDYARLSLDCAPEISRGADDESEMGVFHDLYTPQRAANLRARLDEYAPAAMDAGIIYAS